MQCRQLPPTIWRRKNLGSASHDSVQTCRKFSGSTISYRWKSSPWPWPSSKTCIQYLRTSMNWQWTCTKNTTKCGTCKLPGPKVQRKPFQDRQHSSRNSKQLVETFFSFYSGRQRNFFCLKVLQQTTDIQNSKQKLNQRSSPLDIPTARWWRRQGDRDSMEEMFSISKLKTVF